MSFRRSTTDPKKRVRLNGATGSLLLALAQTDKPCVAPNPERIFLVGFGITGGNSARAEARGSGRRVLLRHFRLCENALRRGDAGAGLYVEALTGQG